MTPDFQVLLGVGGAFAVTGLVEVIKRLLALQDTVWSRFVALIAIVVGIGWNYLLMRLLDAPNTNWWMIAFLGIAAGLSSSGLWSGTKAAAEGVTRMREG